jgi:hypothetical protein
MKKKIIFIILFYLNFPLYAQICSETKSNDLKGQFINGDKFNGKYTYCRFSKPEEGIISQIDLNLDIDGNVNNYIYIGGMNPSIEISDLGIISIFDKFGGMQSPAKITYLTSKNKKLIKIGEIYLDFSLGQVTDYSIENIDDNTDKFIETILSKKQDSFINKATLSYTDYFILFLAKNLLKTNIDTVWQDKFYTKLLSMGYEDIITLYNQNIFYKDSTLCKKSQNEKDAFGCRIGNNQLSICYNYVTHNLLYRFGNKSNIKLELIKELTNQDGNAHIITFVNKNTQYLINTQPKNESIQIIQNGKRLNNYKCEKNSVEPMMLNSFN